MSEPARLSFVAQVRRVTAIIGEIAAASKGQSDGINQVNQAVTQIHQITQQNAALVKEATAAAKSRWRINPRHLCGR